MKEQGKRYEYNKEDEELVRFYPDIKVISKRDPVWRELDPDSDLSRAIFLGQGNWWDIFTIGKEEAKKLLKEWGAEKDEE